VKVGAEPKKVAILIGLGVVAAYLVSRNLFSGTAAVTPARGTAPAAVRRLAEASLPAPPEREPVRVSRRSLEEFRPSLRLRRAEEAQDLSAIDARLRLDLLARLQQVELEGGDRSLFDFGAAPLPKKPEPKIVPKEPAVESRPVEVRANEEARTPPPPPIPLRFYGFTISGRQGPRRAFFLDGEDIYVASEGEIVKKRYKIVRIGITTAVVEDIESKSQQTLPLVAEAG
jgi:hypothetical protein